MKRFFNFFVALILVQFFVSCSSSNQCSNYNNYRIDYYSAGGFTAVEQGVTIKCNGWKYIWTKKPNEKSVISDSLKLDADQTVKFGEMLKSPALYSYHNDYKGNRTTYLVLTTEKNYNSVSFNASDLPGEMPGVMKNLIAEIQKGFTK